MAPVEPRRSVVLIRAASAAAAFCIGVAAVAPAYAGRIDHYHHHPVPEIDGSAGVAALALLASVVIIAYNRIRK
jgi:hypothetical protein